MLLHPKLSQVRRTETHSLRHTEGLVSRRPYLAPLTGLVEDYSSGITQGSAAKLRDMLESQFLSPDRDSTLFELQVGFDVLDALQQLGYRAQRQATLLPGGKAPFATLYGPAGEATIWWQRPAWVLAPDKAGNGLWSQTLEANGLSRQPLRPDFVLDLPHAKRRLLIEVKLTALEAGTPERDGLRDVVAYLADAVDIFEGYPHPHALVAAWNATGRPNNDRKTRIQVSDQHELRATLVEALR
jgi:hypothetical protein